MRRVKDEKKPESKFSEWYQIITTIINYVPQITKSNAYELLNVLLTEKKATLNNNYTITYLKIGVNYITMNYKYFLNL